MVGQRQAVLEHLRKHGEITSMDAFKLYGCTRLAAVIHEFRKLGYVIDTIEEHGKTRYNTPAKYARYVLAKEYRYGGKDPSGKVQADNI